MWIGLADTTPLLIESMLVASWQLQFVKLMLTAFASAMEKGPFFGIYCLFEYVVRISKSPGPSMLHSKGLVAVRILLAGIRLQHHRRVGSSEYARRRDRSYNDRRQLKPSIFTMLFTVFSMHGVAGILTALLACRQV